MLGELTTGNKHFSNTDIVVRNKHNLWLKHQRHVHLSNSLKIIDKNGHGEAADNFYEPKTYL